MNRSSNLRRRALLAACLAVVCSAPAAEFHVSTKGDDANPGTPEKPLRTISAAAQKAQPADTVTVHEGIYRERVDPPRGGSSDDHRITYQAAPGEKVTITGSEPVKGWVKESGETWKVTLPNSFFGNFNPYSDRIRGDWFGPNGRVHHTCCVYLNDDWMIEARSLDEVMKPPGQTPLWFGTVEGDSGEPLVNISWFQADQGKKVPAGEPSWRYGGKPAECSEGGTCSGWIYLGDQLRFDAVDFGKASESIAIRAAGKTPSGSVVEIRLGSAQGELLGTCRIEPTGDWQKWQTFTAKIKPVSGRQTICFVFLTADYLKGQTTIHAQFPGVDPNQAAVEINKRQTVFYPSHNWVNFITVRGFTLRNAATNWAPPSAEQVAVIGTNWSRGWVIENNTICYSKCSGISLGKYGDGTDNTNDAGAADPYTACVRRALENRWSKDWIGGHLVKDNHIHHCEQTGIVGSMGCAFSRVTGNEIHEINSRQLFGGAEQAGIKFHGAIDVVIERNHIYRTNNVSGLWLDWMAQGARVTNNLFHDNNGPFGDIFFEMQHGPILVANNLLLSPRRTLTFNSKGLALVHNLIAGPLANYAFDARNTPFHRPHSTEIAGLHNAPAGDHRFYNNLVTGTCDLRSLDNCSLPCLAEGNVYLQKAQASKFETKPVVLPEADPAVKLTQKDDGWYLSLTADPQWAQTAQTKPVTTASLGKATIPEAAYENTDGTPITIDRDFFGNPRDPAHPFPGPIEISKPGAQEFKVWGK